MVLFSPAAPTMTHDPLAGVKHALSDRYRIEEKVGEGGMSVVYRAQDLKHDRRVAIKVLRPEIAAEVANERFLAEIRVTAQLQHTNALPLFDSGRAGGQMYFVMPFVEGETLQERLNRDGTVPLAEALRIARDVGGALGHAHDMGVVHRDVKPGNILLSRGRALIGDFGIAIRPRATDDKRLTEMGRTPGTSAFMSPEQADGGEIDARSDIYSLACVLYEMLTGQPPFVGANDYVVQVMKATQGPKSMRSLDPAIPETVDDAVLHALDRDPGNRPQTVDAFLDALTGAGSNSGPARGRPPYSLVTAILAILVGGWVIGSGIFTARTDLDPNRVMIFPLVLSEGLQDHATLGEDVATLVGNALDDTGPIRWMDGWTFLDVAQRDDIRGLTLRQARQLTAEAGAGWLVLGRLLDRGDSVDVLLDLTDAATGDLVARGRGTAAPEDAWRGGISAVVELLPALVPGANTEAVRSWRDRDPLAIASFVLGEASFRRVEMDEALDHYHAALQSDPGFAVAAIRGAQAATWAHDPDEARALIAAAQSGDLPPHYRSFARGFDLYLRGRADSAAFHLREATRHQPDMVEAWIQLGEIYTHLLPLEGNPDSLADAAFTEARRLDPEATNLLLHPIEIRLRAGDLAGASPLLERFRADSHDLTMVGKLEVMDQCVRSGSDDVPWRTEAEERPLALLYAAHALSTSAETSACGQAAYQALLQVDTAATPEADGRRWVTLVGAFSAQVAHGNVPLATQTVEDFVARWDYGATVFLLAAPAVPEVLPFAWQVAQEDEARWGPAYGGTPFHKRLWELGILEALDGRVDVAEAVALNLAGRAADAPAGSEDRRYVDALAGSVQAFALLARGETDAAQNILEQLVVDAPVRGTQSWDEAASRALERLTLARLYLDSGDPDRAIAVASVFDSPAPLLHALYLSPSLVLRRAAAEALNNAELAARYARRLSALRGVGV